MDTHRIQLAIFEISASLIIGVMILYLTYFILRKLIKKKHSIANDNVAYAIFVGAILFSVGYIVSSVIEPLLSTFRLFNKPDETVFSLFGQIAKYLFIFFTISTIIAYITNLLGIILFTTLTRNVNEMEEIKNNNVAVSIITASIIIVLTLFIKDGVILLLESIVPYPELPGIM